MLYEMHRFFCKFGLNLGPGEKPGGQSPSADGDRNNDLSTPDGARSTPTPFRPAHVKPLRYGCTTVTLTALE